MIRCVWRELSFILIIHIQILWANFAESIGRGLVSYEFTEGPFTRLLKKAANPGAEYYLIIEEINRDNALQYLGCIPIIRQRC